MKIALLDDKMNVIESVDVGQADVAAPLWVQVLKVLKKRKPTTKGVQFGSGNIQTNYF